MIELIIEGQVVPLKSHRPIYINKATGRPFLGKDKRLRDYEKDARRQLKEQYKGEPIKSIVYVGFRYYVKDKRKRDLINLMETTQDLLQGIVIADDSQIRNYGDSLVVGVDKERPRTNIRIWEEVE